MTAQSVLEGTWEEILAHSPELNGHNVRLTVVQLGTESPVTPSKVELLEEYHGLADVKLSGHLSTTQAERLREIERQLDKFDEQNSNVQALYRRIDEGNAKLDQIIALLDSKKKQH